MRLRHKASYSSHAYHITFPECLYGVGYSLFYYLLLVLLGWVVAVGGRPQNLTPEEALLQDFAAPSSSSPPRSAGCRDAAGITFMDKVSKLRAPGDISNFTELYGQPKRCLEYCNVP